MRSHFRMSSSAAIACAVSGATALMAGVCSAQVVAADSASNPIYTGGWSSGQNAGTGFGAWSFDGTDPAGGPYYGISGSPAWTLGVTNSNSGLAVAGRSITGGLQATETFQAIIQNPVNNAGTGTYRGFDILFANSATNNPGGDNTSALRLQVFDYFNPSMYWSIQDGGSGHSTTLSGMTTGTSAMILDLIVGAGNQYSLILAPESNPNDPYLVTSGTLASSINYVDFRNYNTASGGVNDTANNLSISSMEVIVPEPSSLALAGLGAISFMLARRRK